jgi:hypothetical protein
MRQVSQMRDGQAIGKGISHPTPIAAFSSLSVPARLR